MFKGNRLLCKRDYDDPWSSIHGKRLFIQGKYYIVTDIGYVRDYLEVRIDDENGDNYTFYDIVGSFIDKEHKDDYGIHNNFNDYFVDINELRRKKLEQIKKNLKI